MNDLPIRDFRDLILAAVDANQVTVITAETGAGKSTQVPQYLAEHGYEKIIVTQPRILAARNLFLRVREEWVERHGELAGEAVGYRTSHERDDSEFNTILYCTDGLQLVREITGAGTGKRQILILDEIHEWNQNMEVLVAWAKKRCLEDLEFKVVIMSATIEAEKLTTYYGAGTPILVPGRTFPILMREGADLVDEIILKLQEGSPNMLVFLPGKSEIENVATRIASVADLRGVPVIPLHSQLEVEEQQRAFASYPAGKVVLATNIAQTSVTIEDIDLVIDSGLERRIEILSGIEGLFIAQVSRADCLQRAGRAGRTKSGEYVLAPLDYLSCPPVNERQPFAVPEILRTHLDRLLLRLAGVGIPVEELEFFHAPSVEAIKLAKQTLVNLGAMTAKDQITPLGKRMEKFPVESRYGRMLVEAENLDLAIRVKLAACIAIQEVGGIIKSGTRSLGWSEYTWQTESDVLAHYDVYMEARTRESEELDDLGIISKNVTKATETFERLCYELGVTDLELLPITELEQPQLMRCIVAGQVDQIWSVRSDGGVTHVAGGFTRELSGGTVVERVGLVAGTPFDLEVSTARGLETIHFVQDITAVDPSWLEQLAPHLFSVRPGQIFFDAYRGNLARRWKVNYKGKEVRGASTPVLESTPANHRLFIELCSNWLYEQLDQDRRRVQKETGRHIASPPVQVVQERVQRIIGDSLTLKGLPVSKISALQRLTIIKSYDNRIMQGRGQKSGNHKDQRRVRRRDHK